MSACDIIRLAIYEKNLEFNIIFDDNLPNELIVDGPRIN